MRVEKRVRFVVSTFIMLALFILSSMFEFNAVWIFIPAFIIIAYVLTYFSVLEGIEKIEWLMLFLMPVLFSVSFYLFFHLFPIRWLTRVPFLTIYGISFYAILLTSNIFNVGVEKNIQLHRAAFSVNYFYQSLLFFLLSNVLLSFRSNFVVNGVVFFIAAFLLSAQLLWTVLLENKLSREVLGYSLFISFIIAQAGIAMSFMPIRSSIYSLFMTACYYSLTGLTYHHIDQRLFKKVVQEYLFVLAMVAFLTVLSVAW